MTKGEYMFIPKQLYNYEKQVTDTVSFIIYKDRNKTKAINGDTGVIDYGGVDSASVIQNAIDSLANGSGGIIHIKPGSYNLGNTGITINKDGTTLRGSGRGSTVLMATDGDIVTLSLPTGESQLRNVLIEDLSIGNTDYTGGHGIFSDIPNEAKSIDRLTLNRVRIVNIKGTGKNALYLKNWEKIYIQNCFFYGTGDTLVKLESNGYGSGNLTCIRNTFDTAVGGKTAMNITSTGVNTRGIYFFGNDWLAPSSAPPIGGGTAIYMHAVTGEITHFHITDHFSHFENFIKMEGDSSSYFVGRGNIVGCTFNQFATADNFIYLNTNTRGIFIHNNIFWGYSPAGGYTQYGIVDLNTDVTYPNEISHNIFYKISNPVTPSVTTKIIDNIGYLIEIGSERVKKIASVNVRNKIDTPLTTFALASYIIKKRINLPNGLLGQWRVLFDMKSDDNVTTIYGRVYRRPVSTGIAVTLGAEQKTISSSYVTFSEDITQDCQPGDAIELWCKTGGIATMSIRNFRLAYDDSPTVAVASIGYNY